MEDDEALWRRLADLNKKIDNLTTQEARSAWVNGVAADGALQKYKISLLAQAEDIISELDWRDS